MGKALELLTGIVTAPSTTLTALTMSSGNSNTIRNAKEGSDIKLLTAWVDKQTAGVFRIRSPRLHDNVQGIRFSDVASQLTPLIDPRFPQKLVSQDTLTLELSGSATGGDIESAGLLVYYDDLPGVDGRFIDEAALKSRGVHIVTVENTLALGTAGGYSGEEALNAEFDLLRANTDYAMVGYTVTAECAAVRWRGSDFGNLGVGGPGSIGEAWLTQQWFTFLSGATGLPLIPVFNSANRASILVDGVTDENGTDTTVNLILVQLAPG